MSLIYLALLAAAAEEKNRRTGAHQTSYQKPEKKKGNDYEKELYDYYNSSMDMENFLEALLFKDSEATKVFLLLRKCHKQVDQEDINHTLQAVQNACENCLPQYQLLQSKIISLKGTGIVLDDTSVSSFAYYPVKVKEGKGFGEYGSYAYDTDNYYMGFNGMPLTKEMLEQNINQFQIDLEKLTSTYPNLDDQLTEITAKIAKQKKKLKYNPFNKTKNQELLQIMQSLEKEITEKIAHRTTLETQSKSFDALTEPQKKAILAYLEQAENCVAAGKEISTAISQYMQMKYDIEEVNYSYAYHTSNSIEERNVVQRIIEKAAAQSDFSIEEIESVIERIKKTMDANEFSYTRFKKISSRPYHHPTSTESMYAALFYKKLYKEKQKAKK